MKKRTDKQPNALVVYRRRMRFSQKQVARLLRDRDTSKLSRYEGGSVLPSLPTALRLELIYRAPVAFLFPSLYEQLRTEVRSAERQPEHYGQQAMF